MVGFVVKLIKKMLVGVNKDAWVETISTVQMAINATVSRSTGLAPYEIFFGDSPAALTPSTFTLP